VSTVGSVRLSDAIDDYVKARAARYSPTTVKQDAFVCRRFAAGVGNPLVRNLNAEHVEKWFTALLDDHRTRDGRKRPRIQASTFNYYYARIKALTVYLTRRGMLRTDLLAHIQPLPIEQRKRLQPTPAMLWEMLDSPDNPRDRALLAIAMNTGLRANEIAAIRVEDIDLEALTMRARISKSHLEDDMPITSDLAVELTNWLDIYRHFNVAELDRVLQPSDYLLPARLGPKYRWRALPDGTKERYHASCGYDPLRPTQKLHRVAQAALKAIGLPTVGEGIHTLRRSVARALFDQIVEERGYDSALRVTSSLLHHTNGSTTERYLGLSSERRVRDDQLRGRSLLGPRPRVRQRASVSTLASGC
jgi:integrase